MDGVGVDVAAIKVVVVEEEDRFDGFKGCTAGVRKELLEVENLALVITA